MERKIVEIYLNNGKGEMVFSGYADETEKRLIGGEHNVLTIVQFNLYKTKEDAINHINGVEIQRLNGTVWYS